jgi:hypothetical protein
MKSRIWTAGAVPVAGTWKIGDEVRYTTPVAGGFAGQICTGAGTLAGSVTATTTAASTAVTLAGGAYLGAGVYPGCMITIAGVTGVKTVVSGSGASIVVNTACNASAAAAAVAYSAPVWRTVGAVS